MFFNYLLLFFSICATSGKAIFCKLVGTTNKSTSFFLSNFKSFVVAFILSLIFSINKLHLLFSISTFSILLSLFFAFAVFFTQAMQIKAMEAGSTTLTTLIYSCGFLLPIIYSAIAFSERINVLQIIGVAILLLAIYLIVFDKGKVDGSASLKWFILAVCSMLGSGTIAIIQKTHQLSSFSSELPLFLIYAFLFCSIFSILGHLVFGKAKDSATEISEDAIKTEPPKEPFSIKGFFKKNYSPLLLGVFVGGLNFLNLLLSGKIPSVIHFPTSNVGSLILTNVLSIILFKEKLKLKQKIGCVVGVIAILIVGLF